MEDTRGENPFEEPARKLREADPKGVAERSGAAWEPSGDGGKLLLPVLDGSISVAWPEVSIEAQPGLDSFSLKLLSVLYLANSDGTAPAGEWVAYRELPGGRFYEPVVKRSVEDPLASAFGSYPAGFTSACETLHGEGLSLGDAACSFTLFPNVLLAFILWRSDEEFDARAQVLFDRNDTRHMDAFELRMGAQEISSRIIKASGGGA